MTAPRLTVVGDAMLDRDLDGAVERLAPDVPVPVVERVSSRTRAGGAALAATFAAGARTDVTLVTAIGADPVGRELTALLEQAGIAVVNVGCDGPTIEKTRVLIDGRPFVRVDRGGEAAAGAWEGRSEEAVRGADAVLVSDYGCGVADVARTALEARSVRSLVWDPHPRGQAPVAGTTIATPNLREAKQFANHPDGDEIAVAVDAGARLRREWRTTGVAVTLGGTGAVYVDGLPVPFVVPAARVPNADPCGAGDCFAAHVACALARRLLPSEAIVEGVTAASAFVARQSTDQPAPAPGATKARVVATSGCFDLLHAGHVGMLEAARRLGDRLVVLVNSDASVRRRKGPRRPIVPEADRVAMLEALRCVDEVVVFDEDLPSRALERVRPDVYAKGGDYGVGELPEAQVLEQWGCRAVIVPYLAGRSTTAIVEGISS